MARPYDSPIRYDDQSYTYDGTYIGPVGGDPDELDDCYDLAPNGFAVQVESGGALFPALLDTADDEFWSAAGVATTHVLRYRGHAVSLKASDSVQIGVDSYTVAHTPRRINSSELRAPLTRD
jgi:hypothetical protein